MAEEVFKSPGVSTKEIDLSGPRRQVPVGTPAGVIGTAQRGPAFVPVTIGSFTDFVGTFGGSDGEKFGPIAVNEWLRNATACTYLRVLGVGDGKKRNVSTGKVTNAGFVVGETLVQANGQEGNNPHASATSTQIAGRTYFLGAYMKDASNSTRDSGIDAEFYQVYDVRLINAASPDGYNLAKLTHGSATTNSVYWYEDPSTVGAPTIAFSGVTTPPSSSHNVAYSSGVPHYTNNAANVFTYVATVTNASGDMYKYSNYKVINSDGATTGFSNSGHKYFNNFPGGTHPPARNFAVGAGVTTLISTTPNNIHNTITSNHFTRMDVVTPYGSDNNNRVSFSTPVNIMGTSATTNQVDEDNILISSLGTGSGNGVRVNAGATGDTPTPVSSTFNASATPAVYEAIVRGGTLRHDTTNYTSYLPVGPNYSSGRNGTQYFQVLLTRGAVSEFKIIVSGSYAGCFVCLPENSTWTTGLSNTNGWADMFDAYSGAGNPNNADNGCAFGTVMSGGSGTFTCVFGEESSSNGNNKILVRFKLTSGQSITNIKFQS